MSHGYNLSAEVMNLTKRFEEQHFYKLDSAAAAIEDHTDQMSKISRLLAFLKMDSADSKRVDYSHEGELSEKRKALEDVQAICPHIIPKGTCNWKNEKLTNVMELLENEISQTHTPQISIKTAEANYTQDKGIQAMEAIAHALKREQDQKKYIIEATRRG